MNVIGMLSSIPQMPHSHVQNSSEMNTAAVFILAILPVIHVVTKVPTTVAIASEAPAVSSAVDIASNCMKAAMPMPAAVTAGPRYGMRCSSPAATAQAPAFSRPIQRNAIQVSNPIKTLVTSSMNM